MPEQMIVAYGFNCTNDDCMAMCLVSPHPDRGENLPEYDEWDDFGGLRDCPVCGESMDYNGQEAAGRELRCYGSTTWKDNTDA